MIFLTIGSHEPFDRLVRAFDAWCLDHPQMSGFAQIADVREEGYRPRHCDWAEKLAPADYLALFSGAEVVVSHAGMGSIITAMDLGKPLVIMPRRGHLQETRNDHQWATAKRFAGKPGIVLAKDENDLARAIAQALASSDVSSGASSGMADSALTDAIRDVIMR
jgi:UDP-N-acetylglucosamine transferase subunit ALG13